MIELIGLLVLFSIVVAVGVGGFITLLVCMSLLVEDDYE
jgi:hypothetical protein